MGTGGGKGGQGEVRGDRARRGWEFDSGVGILGENSRVFQRETRRGGGCGGGDGAGAGGGFFVEVDGGGEAFPEGGVADDGHAGDGWVGV